MEASWSFCAPSRLLQPVGTTSPATGLGVRCGWPMGRKRCRAESALLFCSLDWIGFHFDKENPISSHLTLRCKLKENGFVFFSLLPNPFRLAGPAAAFGSRTRSHLGSVFRLAMLLVPAHRGAGNKRVKLNLNRLRQHEKVN